MRAFALLGVVLALLVAVPAVRTLHAAPMSGTVNVAVTS